MLAASVNDASPQPVAPSEPAPAPRPARPLPEGEGTLRSPSRASQLPTKTQVTSPRRRRPACQVRRRVARERDPRGAGRRARRGQALTLVDLLDRLEVRGGLRIAFKVPHEAWTTFDRLFEAHWGGERAPAPAPRQSCRRTTVDRRSGDGTESGCALRPRKRPTGLPGRIRQATAPRRCCAANPSTSCRPELAIMERMLSRLAIRLATRKKPPPGANEWAGAVDLRRSFRTHSGRRASCWTLPAAPARSTSRGSCCYTTRAAPWTRTPACSLPLRSRCAAS